MKTICGIGMLSVGLLLSACDSPTDPGQGAPITEAPGTSVPGGSGAAPGNAFAGRALYVDAWHPANATIAAWRDSRPDDAALLEGIARTPQAVWLTGATDDPARVRGVLDAADGAGRVPVFVLYNIPARDCGGYSGNGGAAAASGYRGWIASIADAMAGRRSLVVLEPDALANMDCLSSTGREERVSLIAGAVRALESAAAAVYLDGGHPRWHDAAETAARLERAGVREAHGFALNVSNFIGTTENVAYGDQVSERLGGMGYVIDTSRNGLGAATSGEWCNPPGRALGAAPTLSPDRGNAHAFLWIKRPGESDGPCNGGPSAGAWWPEYAVGLAERA
ncbi:MAG TPA: glycoside hydrolase family 6 protein [Longimicrobiales bacterium]